MNQFIKYIQSLGFILICFSHIITSSGICSEIPSPDDLCVGVTNHYKCAKIVEKAWITNLKGKIYRQGNGRLILTLNNGKTILKKDSLRPFEGYWDSEGKVNRLFTFADFLKKAGYYVIEAHYYEAVGTQFINIDNGTSVEVWGIPNYSPDRSLFLTHYADAPHDPIDQEIEIWSISKSGIKKEWTHAIKNWPYISLKWLDQKTIEVYNAQSTFEKGENQPEEIIARITKINEIWQITTIRK